MAGLHLLLTGALCTGLLLPAAAIGRACVETPGVSDHTLICICSLVQKLKIMAERKIVSFLPQSCKFDLF